jgi:hypothetical protein
MHLDTIYVLRKTKMTYFVMEQVQNMSSVGYSEMLSVTILECNCSPSVGPGVSHDHKDISREPRSQLTQIKYLSRRMHRREHEHECTGEMERELGRKLFLFKPT